MLQVAALGAAHAASIARLASRPDVVAFGAHEAERSPTAWVRWLGPPDPHAACCLGAWRDGELVGAARLTLNATRRQMHGAHLDLLVSSEPSGDEPLHALLGALTDASDRWLQVSRCALACPAEHRRIAGLFAEHGFVEEARHRASIRTRGALADEVTLARVRDDVPVPEPLATTLRLPPSRPRAERLRVHIRPVQWSDGPKLAATMSEPTIVWGTLQLPFQRPERWDERLAHPTSSRTILLVAEVGGEMAGGGALTRALQARRAHVATLGMHVVTRFQGCGVGGALMGALLDRAAQKSISRVELTVYPDNVRAVRLYERAGFVHEGRSRRSSFRDGTYVDDLVMARVDVPR